MGSLGPCQRACLVNSVAVVARMTRIYSALCEIETRVIEPGDSKVHRRTSLRKLRLS